MKLTNKFSICNQFGDTYLVVSVPPGEAVIIQQTFFDDTHPCPIILKFCTQHGSYTAVLCAKFQND